MINVKLNSHKGERLTTKKFSTAVRKEQIVAAALQILSDNGSRQLKISSIAENMGLAPSALYRHFKNRDAILSAVLEHIRTRLFTNLARVRQSTDNGVERLRQLLFQHAKLINEEHGIPRIVFSEELWGQESGRREKLYHIVTGYLAEVEGIVREGQSRKHIRKNIDAQVVARMFFGILQPAILLWHMSEGQFDFEGHLVGVWPVFQEMLTGE